MMFVKKWPLEYENVIKTYLPAYLWNSSKSSESSESSESSDSSDQITLQTIKLKLTKTYLPTYLSIYLPTYLPMWQSYCSDRSEKKSCNLFTKKITQPPQI